MKILPYKIATVLFIFFCISINAQEKANDFQFKELKSEPFVIADCGTNQRYNAAIEQYNKGIQHYNGAIKQLKATETEISVEELDALQKSCIEEFKQALVYFEKAHNINPRNGNILKALQGCYFSLNDKTNFEKYRKELEALDI